MHRIQIRTLFFFVSWIKKDNERLHHIVITLYIFITEIKGSTFNHLSRSVRLSSQSFRIVLIFAWNGFVLYSFISLKPVTLLCRCLWMVFYVKITLCEKPQRNIEIDLKEQSTTLCTRQGVKKLSGLRSHVSLALVLCNCLTWGNAGCFIWLLYNNRGFCL